MENFPWRPHRHAGRSYFVALFFCCLVHALCARGIPSVALAQDGVGQGALNRGLRIILVPEKNAYILRSQFKPVVDFLAQKTGRTIYLEVAPDYQYAVQALADGDADIGFLGAQTYLLARQQARVEPVVRPLWPERKNICRSYVFVRKEDGIRELHGMEGARLAVVDRNSLSGFLFAYCFFVNSGIRQPESYFGRIIWAGSHDTSVWSVVTGEADVGVANSRVFDALLREYPEEVGKLLVLTRSAELPTLCCVVGPDFPETEKERLVFLFSQMDKTEEGKQALAALGAVSFVRAYDAEYNFLRQAFAAGDQCSLAPRNNDLGKGSR